MTINTKERLSPGWRLERLMRKLELQNARVKPLFERYEGKSPLPEHMVAAPESAKQFYRLCRTQFAEMVVKAVKYPLRIQSISTSQDQSDVGDPVAEAMFRTSGMVSEVDDVHRLSLTAGNGYAMVALYAGEVAYTSEDPRQVVTRHDPVRQSRVMESAKRYWDEDAGEDVAFMFIRETDPATNFTTRWVKYRATRPNPTGRFVKFSASQWSWDTEAGGVDGEPLPPAFNATGPLFRYRNEEGVSEFERHMGLLDRLDHFVLQGLITATVQAFKQRAIMVPTKDMPDEDPETGEEIDYNDILTVDPGAIWKLPDTAKIWESGIVDLTPIWSGLEKFTQQLSAVTFTPLSVFSPEGQNQSAEGANLAREGRTFKVEARHDRFGPVHAQALSLMFSLAGDEKRADLSTIHVQWRPAERYTLAEKADAMVKYKAGGVPWHTRMVEVGQFSPEVVQRMATERMSDEVLFPSEAGATTAAVNQAV